MAERRMFSKTVIDSDYFLDMAMTAQCLYFHLAMRADDDGFVNNPRKIQRMVGASDDDFKLLLLKSFIIPFESGVCVVRHWRVHNYIRSDRYKETLYKSEKSMLIEADGVYDIPSGMSLGIPNDNQAGGKRDTQDRLGKDSSKDNIYGVADAPKKTNQPRFVKPTLDEVAAYCQERKNNISAQLFIDHYEANGWVRGKTPVRDWRACVRTWEKNNGKDKMSAPDTYDNILI